MSTERRGAPVRDRDGARTAVASVITGILMTGPVALVLGVVSLVARPAAAVRRLAVVGCVLGLLGTAGWGLWAVSVPTGPGTAVAVAAPTPVRLALPPTAVALTDERSAFDIEAGSRVADATESASATVTIEDLDGSGEVPVLGMESGLVLSLPLDVATFSTSGWTVDGGDGTTETMHATFTHDGTAVNVVVTLHPTATDAEAAIASAVRDRLTSPDASERSVLTVRDGAEVRRVVEAGVTTFAWSEFTASVEVDGPSKAARVFVDRFLLGPGEQGGQQSR